MTREGVGIRSAATLLAIVVVVVGLVAGTASASPSTPNSTCGLTASVSVDPTSGDAGTPVTVSGTGYCSGTAVFLKFLDASRVLWQLQSNVAVAEDGTFSATVDIPDDAAIGRGQIKVPDRRSQQCAWVYFEVTAPG
jgi:hypothetical protein